RPERNFWKSAFPDTIGDNRHFARLGHTVLPARQTRARNRPWRKYSIPRFFPCPARNRFTPDSSRLRHRDRLGISPTREISRCAQWPSRARTKANLAFANCRPEERSRGVLQFARSSSPSEISIAGFVPGFPSRKRRQRDLNVWQRLNYL